MSLTTVRVQPTFRGRDSSYFNETNEKSRADFSSALRDAKRAAARDSSQVDLSKPPAPRVQRKLRRVARCRADCGLALPWQIGQNGQAGRIARSCPDADVRRASALHYPEDANAAAVADGTFERQCGGNASSAAIDLKLDAALRLGRALRQRGRTVAGTAQHRARGDCQGAPDAGKRRRVTHGTGNGVFRFSEHNVHEL